MNDFADRSHLATQEVPNYIPEESGGSPREVFADRESLDQMLPMLNRFLADFKLPEDLRRRVTGEFLRAGESAQTDGELHSKFMAIIEAHKLRKKIAAEKAKFERLRPSLMVKWLGEFLKGESVVDIGAGRGDIGKAIQEKLRKKVILVDVVDINISDLPLQLYNGEKLPLSDGEVDTALLVASLHHSRNPQKVLQEAARVAKERVIFLEPVVLSEVDRKIQIFFDWLIGVLMWDEEVDQSNNLNSPKGWMEIMEKIGLKKILVKNVDPKGEMAPERPWVFVFEK